jgi:hypothetical protein
MTKSRFLNNTAATEYLENCRFELWMGIIGPDEFLGRLLSLRALCIPTSAVWHYCQKLLEFEDLAAPEDWPRRSEQEIENAGAPLAKSKSSFAGDADDEEPHFIHFIPSIQSGLNSWEFHKGDADPFPTVPHGHFLKHKKKKLDPYRGFVYELGKQVDRVRRDCTVALWNDRMFRRFAREAIEHFMGSNPRWRWDVREPRRLPRIRR